MSIITVRQIPYVPMIRADPAHRGGVGVLCVCGERARHAQDSDRRHAHTVGCHAHTHDTSPDQFSSLPRLLREFGRSVRSVSPIYLRPECCPISALPAPFRAIIRLVLIPNII